MKAIIVGCGRAGAELASRLSRLGHRVTVIDVVAEAFDNLSAEFRGHIIQGEVLNQDILANAGIQEADCVATLTNSDALNAVVAHIARTVYRVPTVVARNYDPRWMPLHEAFGIQVVSSVLWNAKRFEELLQSAEVGSVYSVGSGEVSIYDVMVPEQLDGGKLEELVPGGDAIVVAVTRSGQGILPEPDMILHAQDVVHISATVAGAAAVRQRVKERV